jgi:glutaminyl-peptide cyclotransferase
MRRVWVALAAIGIGSGLGAAAHAFPAERAMEHLRAQCAFGPRNPGSAGHAACRDYIVRVLRDSGGRVREQAFEHTAPALTAPVRLTNVIARFGPSRPGGLLLGAHWDTRPWADLDPDSSRRDEPILGANDGGSGTAVLLALAETFRERPPAIPVVLVFFDGEDLGRPDKSDEYLVGSKYFAGHLEAPYPQAGLVLDMVGSENLVLTQEENARQAAPDFAKLLDDLALNLGLEGYQPGIGPPVYDDHVPLIEAGLPTLLLIDFRDPQWHTHGDTPAHCRAASLGVVGRLTEALLEGGFFR